MAKHPPFPDSSMGNSVAVERCWERSPCSGAVPPSFSSFFLSLLIGMLLFLSLYVSSFGEEVGGGPEAARSAFSLSTSPRRGGTSGGCGPLLCSLRGPPPPPIPAQTLPFCPVPRFKANPAGKGVAGGLAEEERLLLQQIAAGGNPFPSYPPDGSTHTPPPPHLPLPFFLFFLICFYFFFAFNPFFFHADGAGGWWGAEPNGLHRVGLSRSSSERSSLSRNRMQTMRLWLPCFKEKSNPGRLQSVVVVPICSCVFRARRL